MQYGKKFTKEFIETFLWNKFWLNDRELSRRPWIHEPNYKIIDNILKNHPRENNKYNYRKLESEYSIYYLNKFSKNEKKIKQHKKKKC